jgi:hypothetical protein
LSKTTLRADQLGVGHALADDAGHYGTQIDEDAKGSPYILPLEDPGKVDQYLKAIGAPPLSQYMADASAALYNGRPIRLATPEESD